MGAEETDGRELLNVLREHAQGQASQSQVAEALRSATLLLPTQQHEGKAGGASRSGASEPPRDVVMLENERGETAVPAFTHEGALREWAPQGTAYIGMSTSDLFAIALERDIDKVLINPASPEGIQIGRPGIHALIEELDEEE